MNGMVVMEMEMEMEMEIVMGMAGMAMVSITFIDVNISRWLIFRELPSVFNESAEVKVGVSNTVFRVELTSRFKWTQLETPVT